MAFLDNSRRRLDRARAHRDAFISAWSRLLKQDSFTYTTVANSDGSFSVWAMLSHPIDTDIPLLLGEFFYQLRSALDGAVFESAMLRHPTMGESGIEFIIMPDETEFRKRQWKIKALSDNLHSLSEWYNPTIPT